MSACRAAIPMSRRSPLPPIRMGGRRTGFGSHTASRTVQCLPSKVVRSSVQSRRRTWAVSSSAPSLAPREGKGQP